MGRGLGSVQRTIIPNIPLTEYSFGGMMPWRAPQMSFVTSPEGVQYDQLLFEKFEAVRQKRNEAEIATDRVT